MKEIEYAVLKSPVGNVGLAWSGNVLVLAQMDVAADRTDWNSSFEAGSTIHWMKNHLQRRFEGARLRRGDADAAPVRILRRYFAGETNAIDELRTDPGGTEFQAAIWRELRRIPAGQTRTYGELARRAGHPGAARAAGGAVGANPIPIVIPCHRILGTNGGLTGFGGGVRRKHWLLTHEGAAFRDESRQLRFA